MVITSKFITWIEAVSYTHLFSLDAGAEAWADEILKYKDYKKVTKRNQLEEKGFSSEIIEKKIKEMVNH